MSVYLQSFLQECFHSDLIDEKHVEQMYQTYRHQLSIEDVYIISFNCITKNQFQLFMFFAHTICHHISVKTHPSYAQLFLQLEQANKLDWAITMIQTHYLSWRNWITNYHHIIPQYLFTRLIEPFLDEDMFVVLIENDVVYAYQRENNDLVCTIKPCLRTRIFDVFQSCIQHDCIQTLQAYFQQNEFRTTHVYTAIASCSLHVLAYLLTFIRVDPIVLMNKVCDSLIGGHPIQYKLIHMLIPIVGVDVMRDTRFYKLFKALEYNAVKVNLEDMLWRQLLFGHESLPSALSAKVKQKQEEIVFYQSIAHMLIPLPHDVIEHVLCAYF